MTNPTTHGGRPEDTQAGTPAAGSPLRELTPAELQHVAGGLPGSSWRTAESTAPQGQADVQSLPGGSW